MSFFPVVFIGTLAFCHVYVFWRFCTAFEQSAWRYPVLLLIVLGLTSIFLRPRLTKTAIGPAFANLMFAWLGFMAIMTIVLVCRDALFLALKLHDRVLHADWASVLAGARSIRIALSVGVLAFGYGLLEARQVRTTAITMPTDRLPPGTERVRVVAVSDVHLTARGDEARLRRLVRLVNSQKPDIVVMLGDLVDDWIIDRDELSAELGKIDAPMGKFAVTGNHELYSGMHQSIDFIRKSGLRLLHGECVTAGPIDIVGVDDPAFRERVGIADAVRKANPNHFVLLLTHRPEAVGAAHGGFDLQLSGHTHGGQLLPARIVTGLLFGRGQGMTDLKNTGSAEPPNGKQSKLYLTNGAGYWGPPVRFLAPPEIVVLDIIRKDT